ncbi:MAG: STAS/SEC14 domain-containing protein [Ghiorsea sp.]
MFKIKLIQPNVLQINVGGKLDATNMQRGLDEFLSQANDIQQGQLLYVVRDLHMPTLEAVGIEFSKICDMFGLIKKFSKAAVLTDRKWIQTVSEIKGSLLPGITIKAFDLAQKEEALAWLKDSKGKA